MLVINGVLFLSSKDFYKNKSWLHKRYVQDKRTPQQIADECGVTLQTIYLYLGKFNLKMGRKGRR
jgi:hypothetical protein